jgi:hypothetical protein
MARKNCEAKASLKRALSHEAREAPDETPHCHIAYGRAAVSTVRKFFSLLSFIILIVDFDAPIPSCVDSEERAPGRHGGCGR